MGNLRFQKSERLNSKKLIDGLFETGRSFSAFPLRLIFNPAPGADLHQVLVSVPSRTFKRAVDRNALKRRIREGYRLHKALLPPSPTFSLAYIYIAKEILPSATIHNAIQSSLKRLGTYEEKD